VGVQRLARQRQVSLAESLVLGRVSVQERGDVLGHGVPADDERASPICSPIRAPIIWIPDDGSVDRSHHELDESLAVPRICDLPLPPRL
jgi:hypothetical protein